MTGPYETERDAAAATVGKDSTAMLGQLTSAIVDAGVTMGEHDQAIASWFARTWEPSTVQVVVGLIERAFRSGQDSAVTELAGPIYDFLNLPPGQGYEGIQARYTLMSDRAAGLRGTLSHLQENPENVEASVRFIANLARHWPVDYPVYVAEQPGDATGTGGQDGGA